MRIFGLIILALIILSVATSGFCAEGSSTPSNISEIINDAATFKLITVGRFGRAEEFSKKLMAAADKIATKYQIDLQKVTFTPEEDVDIPLEQKRIKVTVPSMTQIVAFENSGILPAVKFKGTIELSDNMSIKFGDKTECMVDGKEYIFTGGKWAEK